MYSMEIERGQKEKPRFASPVPRGGQNEVKRKDPVHKKEMIKKVREKEEKAAGEGKGDLSVSSGQTDLEAEESFRMGEKSMIRDGNSDAGAQDQETNTLESERENLCLEEMMGWKFTKAEKGSPLKSIESEENQLLGNLESGLLLKAGGSEAELRQVEFIGEKKPIISQGAESSPFVGKETENEEVFSVGVQGEKVIKKKQVKKMREEKGDGKEKGRWNTMDSRQNASQRAAGGQGKSTKQSFSSKDPQPIGSQLSDGQYDEIFKSVLAPSLERCLEDAKAVLSEVESLQASIDESCESGATGANWEGEEERSRSCKSEQRSSQRKERKLQKSSVEAVSEKTSGKQIKEFELEHNGSNGSEEEYHSWVQCSRTSCKKWRKLEWNTDLSVLPADWVCSYNTDPHHCSCDCPEEAWRGSEEDVVDSSLVPGSLVWAHQPGFPWWPAMIETDSDFKSSFLFKNKKDKFPFKYHVTYFGEPVSHAWVSASRVKASHTLTEADAWKTVKQQSYMRKFSESLNMSRQAEKLPLEKRLAQFGFLSRYSADRKISEEDSAPGGGEGHSCDEEDFAFTPNKRRKKGVNPGAKQQAAKLAPNLKQNGINGLKLSSNNGTSLHEGTLMPQEIGKKQKEMVGKKNKGTHKLLTEPRERKAASKPESCTGQADSCAKEPALLQTAGKKVIIPKFTKPKDKTIQDKQAALVEKPQTKVRDQTIQGISANRDLEGGDGVGERGSCSSTEDREDRKPKKIKGQEDGIKRVVRKDKCAEGKKRKIQRELKREVCVTKDSVRQGTSERQMKEDSELERGEEPEKGCMKKHEESVALEELKDFLEDDMEILTRQGEFFNGEDSQEEEDEDFDLILFKGVKATYLPV